MARTFEEMTQAVDQIRRFARGYAKPKRKEFFENLYLYLSDPLPEDESRKVALETKYLMAVAALTAEIQPASAETYDQVLQRLNAVLLESKLGDVWISTEPKVEQLAQSADSDGPQLRSNEDGQVPARAYSLRGTLAPRRKLSKAKQALVDRFREDLPESGRPFDPRSQIRG